MRYPFKLSVILPCYNVEKYLDLSLRCLENQWDDDSLEIVFVNDCSTDGTLNRLRAFCDDHPHNTRLVNKTQNEGVSKARDDGLSVARGQWITFLDPDDALVDNAYKDLYEHYVSEDIQVLSFETNIHSEKEEITRIISSASTLPYSRERVKWVGTGKEFFKRYLTNVCWIFFYSHQLIDRLHVKFRDLTYLEDALFNMDIILNDGITVKRVDCKYHYWIHRANSLSNIQSPERNVELIDNIMTALGYMQEMKNGINDAQVIERISWKQQDSSRGIVPILLRCNIHCNQIRSIRQQLKSWNAYPYHRSRGRSDVLFDFLFRFPHILSTMRLFIR